MSKVKLAPDALEMRIATHVNVVRPCPFCGRHPLMHSYVNEMAERTLYQSRLQCSFPCMAEMMENMPSRAEAQQAVIDKWNGRADLSGWIACSDRMPECPHEDNDGFLSQSLLVCDADAWPSLGMAHLRDGGKWELYGGDHDFMLPVNITHWMPLPQSPGRQAAVRAQKAGEVKS